MNKYTGIMMSNLRLMPIIKEIYKTTELVTQYGNVRLLKSLELGSFDDAVRTSSFNNNANNHMNVEYGILNKSGKKTTITCSLERPVIYSYIDKPESLNIKYKQRFYSVSYDKLCETIVEIANSGGGKLVWGIRKDLFIVGVENRYSLWDNHCFHISETLKNSNTSNVPGVKFTEQRLSEKRSIYQVTIAPSREMFSYKSNEVTRIEFNILKQQLKSMREDINAISRQNVQC
jgi:hypothetical protein